MNQRKRGGCQVPSCHVHVDPYAAGFQASGQWMNFRQPTWQLMQCSLIHALAMTLQTTILTRPAAIFTAQLARELYMRGALCAEVWCNLQVPADSDSGIAMAYVKRYLISWEWTL